MSNWQLYASITSNTTISTSTRTTLPSSYRCIYTLTCIRQFSSTFESYISSSLWFLILLEYTPKLIWNDCVFQTKMFCREKLGMLGEDKFFVNEIYCFDTLIFVISSSFFYSYILSQSKGRSLIGLAKNNIETIVNFLEFLPFFQYNVGLSRNS